VSAFDDLAAVAPQLLAEGYIARAVHGEQLTLAVVEIDPGAALPEHSHANEQFGIVLEGFVVFRVGDEQRTLERGSIWRIPSGTPHAVTGGDEGAVVIDVFAPPRDDWRERETVPPQPPIWP
jgi:quercetin dioxygenase-like cupin family protein